MKRNTISDGPVISNTDVPRIDGEVSDAQVALFAPDPLSDFVINFKASALPPKRAKEQSTTISASGQLKWRLCMDKNFSGRGEMSRFLYHVLQTYFDLSGAIVEDDGTIKSKQLSLDI